MFILLYPRGRPFSTLYSCNENIFVLLVETHLPHQKAPKLSLVQARFSNMESSVAFAAHSIICGLVCMFKQWRLHFSPAMRVPFLLLTGSGNARISVAPSMGESFYPVHAWDSVACCVAAAKGGHLGVLKWVEGTTMCPKQCCRKRKL